jgi:hypothetical protein
MPRRSHHFNNSHTPIDKRAPECQRLLLLCNHRCDNVCILTVKLVRNYVDGGAISIQFDTYCDDIDENKHILEDDITHIGVCSSPWSALIFTN